MKSTKPLFFLQSSKSRKQHKQKHIKHDFLFHGSHKTPRTPNGEFSQQPSKQLTMALPKFGQVVNSQFDDVSLFYVPNMSWQYILIVYFLAQLQEIQLIHTNLAVSIYLQHNETLCAKIWTEPSPNRQFQATYWRIYHWPVDTKMQHIHDENLDVLFVWLHVSTKNAQVVPRMLLTHVPSIQDAYWFSLPC